MSEVSRDLLSGIPMIDKVAQFCVLIGEEATVKIFQNLPTETVEQISTAITSKSLEDCSILNLLH